MHAPIILAAFETNIGLPLLRANTVTEKSLPDRARVVTDVVCSVTTNWLSSLVDHKKHFNIDIRSSAGLASLHNNSVNHLSIAASIVFGSTLGSHSIGESGVIVVFPDAGDAFAFLKLGHPRFLCPKQ